MNSKESSNNIKNLFIGGPINPTQQFEINEKYLEKYWRQHKAEIDKYIKEKY